jgi:uncharacterized protein YxjI
MQFLLEYNDYEPKKDLVKDYYYLVNDKYQIYDHDGNKYISIDDKNLFITGWLYNKGITTNKIFYDIKDEIMDLHEPSLRKAIKEWLDDK